MMIDQARVSRIAEAVRKVGMDAVRAIEENDPQYKALRRLVEGLGDPCLAGFLAVANALVSYRLSLPGEEYWEEFSEAALRYRWGMGIQGFFEDFLRSSKANRLGVEAKLRRIRRLLGTINPEKICGMCGDLEGLRTLIARALGSKPGSKTIVFAVKMYYYICRITGDEPRIPMGIEIPVDSRIALLAATSGIIVDGGWRSIWRRLYREEPGLAARAWGMVAQAAGVPPLNLDALLWLPARAAREAGYRREEAVRRAYQYLSSYAGRGDKALLMLCRELFARMD